MKSIFKFLSGKPKDGDIIECINPIIVLPKIMISIIAMSIGIKYRNPFIGIISLLFSWQIGWGMSIKRFNNKENQ